MSLAKNHKMCKSAALDFVEMRIANHSDSCYGTHSHDEFSFGVIDQGRACYKNTRSNHDVGQGATVTINPGEAHSCNPDNEVWSYRMLFIDTAWITQAQRDVCKGHGFDYGSFEQHFLHDVHSYKTFSALFSLLLVEDNALVAEGVLVEYCAQLFNASAVFESTPISDTELAQQMIMDQLDQSVSLTDLCELVELSPFHLIRSFKKRYGQSPHAYQLDQRIKRARLLLKSGWSLASTASALGFSDQSHFQRNFKKRTALTPRQYQQFFV
jgi:AraC-like DNA-binding protein